MAKRKRDDDRFPEPSGRSFPARPRGAGVGRPSGPVPGRRQGIAPLGIVLREGVTAGALGFVAGGVVTAGLDVLAGESPFHTAGRIGARLFFGGLDPAVLPSPEAPVAGWALTFLLAPLAGGVTGALLVLQSERLRGFWFFSLMLVVALGALGITLLVGVGGEVARVVSVPRVVLGALAWLAAIAGYYWRTRRGLVRRVQANMEHGRLRGL